MKKLIFVFLSVALLVACAGNSDQKNDSSATDAQMEEMDKELEQIESVADEVNEAADELSEAADSILNSL